jgi:hypothetical protein
MIADTILLRCSKAELEKMDWFFKTTLIEEKVSGKSFGYGGQMCGTGSYYDLSYIDPGMTVQVSVEHRQIPPGELAVRPGTRVEATGGYLGQVDEF